MIAVYGNEIPLFKMKFWSKQFRWGQGSIQDDPISGRPVEARTENMVEEIEDVRSADEFGFHCQGNWSTRNNCLESSLR
jgi:hypothetical protein